MYNLLIYVDYSSNGILFYFAINKTMHIIIFAWSLDNFENIISFLATIYKFIMGYIDFKVIDICTIF